METALPKSSNNNRSITFLLILFVLAVTSSVYLYAQNQTFKKELLQTQQELSEKKTKSVSLLFDPSQKYVDSLNIYQTLSGKVVEFDKTSNILTLEKLGDKFQVRLSSVTTGGSSDNIKDISKVKVGDRVRISGRYMPDSEEFVISQFIITQDFVKP